MMRLFKKMHKQKLTHKVWIRLGGYVNLTEEEFDRINQEHGGKELAEILATVKCERFTPDGDTYSPAEDCFENENIGTGDGWGCNV